MKALNGIRLVLFSLVACALLSFAASGAEAAYVGAAKDPAGDSADPDPGRDITAVGLGYDRRSGALIGALRLRGAPSSESSAFITLVAGVRTASGCNGYPAIGFGSYSDEHGASWLKLAPTVATDRGEADKSGYLDAVQKFEITAGALAGNRPDCVVATLTEPGNPDNVYDSAGPVPLRPLAGLEAQLGNVPEVMRPGRERRLKLVLRNPGDAPTGRVQISVKRARGLTVKLTRRLPSIAPGKRRSVTLRTTLANHAASPARLRVIARAGNLLARTEVSLDVLRGSPSKGDPDDGYHAPQLCNRWIPDLSGETGGSLVLVPC